MIKHTFSTGQLSIITLPVVHDGTMYDSQIKTDYWPVVTSSFSETYPHYTRIHDR